MVQAAGSGTKHRPKVDIFLYTLSDTKATEIHTHTDCKDSNGIRALLVAAFEQNF